MLAIHNEVVEPIPIPPTEIGTGVSQNRGKSAPNGRLKQINAAGAASSIGPPDTCPTAENGSILPINARAAGERDARAAVLPAGRREDPWMVSAVDGAVIAALH